MMTVDDKIDIKSLTPEELADYFAGLGQPAFRSKQVFSWLSSGCGRWDVMTDLPKALRAELSEKCHLYAPEAIRTLTSAEDGTVKYLWRLHDGNAVETVVMRYHYGNTVCISSQVGCRQGCAFCASTIGGLVRNLNPSEMLDEVLFSEKESGLKISNIVLMGIGEPLDNFDNVMRFLELINHPKGRNIGMRHISLSTCGILERFDDLAQRDLQLTLSVSLHAPDDETRSRLMPANRNRGVDALFEKCAEYFSRTGRRISFEYAMIRNVNDSPQQAQLLSERVKPLAAHVNLIPLNHVDERSFEPSTPEDIRRFVDILTKNGVNVTVRRRLGSDVNASCGQLRRNTVGIRE